MIDFRYHVVSIVAVFLALTVGLVLGASFLKGAAVQNLSDSINSLTAQRNNLQQTNRTQTNSITSLDNYIAGTAPILVQNYLNGDNVVVIEVAGEDPALTAATVALLGKAGAKVTADITVTPQLTATDAPTEATLSGLVTSTLLPLGQNPATGPAAVQAAAVLATALTVQPPPPTDGTGGAGSPTTGATTPPATPPAGAPTQTPTPTGTATGPGTNATPTGMTYPQAQTAIAAFATDRFIAVNTVPAALKPADAAQPTLAFIAAPTTANTPAQNAAYVTLAEALRADGATPVMGGAAENNTAGSSQDGGLLDAALKDGTAAKQIATVDNMNLTIGQVAVVFTLWEADANAMAGSTNPAKHYGSVGPATQGLLPQLSPLPQPTVQPTGTGTPAPPTPTP